MRNVLPIAKCTFRESLRSKVFLLVFFFTVALLCIGTLFGSVTIGDQERVIKDFGLFALSLFTCAFVVISGSAMVFKELSRKTIYNILAKPVRRSEFLVGKFLGMYAVSLVLVVTMGAGLALYSAALSGRIDLLLWEAYLLIALEMLIVCAGVIFFSTIVVTPALAGLFAFGLFIAGRSIEYLLSLISQNDSSSLLASTLGVVYWLLPHLNQLYVGDQIVYGEALAPSFLVWAVSYSLGYSIALLSLSSIIFELREFN